MNIQEFAKMLSGREYGMEITRQEVEQAKELGFVVVYGYSDDNAELDGAIREEIGCYGGGMIYLDENGVFEGCDDNCKYSQAAREKCKTIEAMWCDGEDAPAWTYKTDIPCAEFNIMEDGEVWCRGIVFDIKSLG